MPVSKAGLNLDAWARFKPQERPNDFEYNLLLHKFRAFYKEVQDYCELHRDCPQGAAAGVSRSTVATSFGPPEGFGLGSAAYNSNNNNSTTTEPAAAAANTNNKKQYFQQQHSFPSSTAPQPLTAAQKVFLNKQNSYHQTTSELQHTAAHQTAPDKNHVQLHNSEYNLNFNKSTNNLSQATPATRRPEARQRATDSSRLLLHSKSSERLDCLNNNHIANSTKSPPNPSFAGRHSNNNNNFALPSQRDDFYFQDDCNIYDAVSPDNEQPINVAASVHNLNQLSVSQKVARLEPSRSTIGLNQDLKIKAFASSRNEKNTQPWSHDTPRAKGNNFYGLSSNFGHDNGHDSSSSLSVGLTHQHQQLQNVSSNGDDDSLKYSNYVNIDFFLQRGASPPFEDERAGDDDNDEDTSSDNTTQMSTSSSSSEESEDSVKELSPQFNTTTLSAASNNNNSTASVTTSSSGDLLSEQPNSSSSHNINLAHSKYSEVTSRLNSLFSAIESNEHSSRQIGTVSDSNSILDQQSSLGHHQDGSVATGYSDKYSHVPIQKDGDENALAEAHNTMRSFLSELNLSIDDVFEDKAQRRIVKESFAVEFCGRRKLRHMFLFNDVIVCAKYQASSKQKFTFDVRWYLNLSDIVILEQKDLNNSMKFDKEALDNQILSIRTNLMLLRSQSQQIKRTTSNQPSKAMKKLKKKRTELEAELVLLLPHLPLVIKHLSGKKYTFFLSSNFDRNQWIESIKFLQTQLSANKGSSKSPSSSELQAWIQTCRKNLNPSLGTFLLRLNCDDDLLYGDLFITLNGINGSLKPGSYYFCFEVDSYGHFSQKASSSVFRFGSSNQCSNDEYVCHLDGSHTLRILLYQDSGINSKPSVIGKALMELSLSWLSSKPVDKMVDFNSNCGLKLQLSYSSSELLSMRIPHTKLCAIFGLDITQVCKKEKTEVPLLIQLCVNEVERRGMREVGIYRMSGTSTDVQRLKKAFETNPYVAELLLRDIDINSVTGFLKTYLREMPEGLFSNKLYSKFVAAFNIPQSNVLERTKRMLQLFNMIPKTNQHTINYLVTHLVKVNKYEIHNKMSLTNLATVLGPNILKPPTESSGSGHSSDPFTAVVIGSMSQAGILYFFLNRKLNNLPLFELDPSELSPPSMNNEMSK